MMKTIEQRKRDVMVSDLEYGKMVDLGLGDRVYPSFIDGGSTMVYEVYSCGDFQESFNNPHDALGFIMGCLLNE